MHRRTRMLRICTVVTSRGEGGRGCVGGGCSCHLSAPRSLLSQFEQHVREQRGSKLKNTQWRRRRTHVHLPDLCVSVCGVRLRWITASVSLSMSALFTTPPAPHPEKSCQDCDFSGICAHARARACVCMCLCSPHFDNPVVYVGTWLVHVCLMLPEVSVLLSYGSMCSASITLDLLAQW